VNDRRAGARPERTGALRIPLIPLRTFHAVALDGSFSRAARRLGVSQPAVTQQIRRLEQSVGLVLFDRAGRRVTTTDAGRLLDTYARRILHLLDAARDAMDGLAGVQTGCLAIGASRTAGAYYIAGLLDRFKQRHPGVKVSLSVGNSEAMLARVLDFDLHAAMIAGPCDHPQIVSVPMVSDPLLVVLPPGHTLGGQAAVGIQDLRRYPLITREPGSTTRRIIERAFRAHRLDMTPAMELESNEAIKSAVEDGIGVGMMAHAAVVQEIETGRLVGRPLRTPLHLRFVLIYHRDRARAPAVAAFLDLLSEYLAPAGLARDASGSRRTASRRESGR
jgi:DNA-binding transcriptional LysR family regulator